MFKPDQFINGTIEQQTVYYTINEAIPSGEPHYFVILNVDPKKDQVLYLACATSKVEKTKAMRANLPSTTVVVVTPQQCEFLKKESAFDCNSLFEMTIEQLVQKRTIGKLDFKGKMSDIVFKQLIEGTLASPLNSNKAKKAVLKDNY